MVSISPGIVQVDEDDFLTFGEKLVMPGRLGDAMASLLDSADDKDRKSSLMFLAGLIVGKHLFTDDLFFYSTSGQRASFDPTDPDYPNKKQAMYQQCYVHRTQFIINCMQNNVFSQVDYSNSFVKLSYFALLSMCKEVNQQNSEFLKKRYTSYMASIGETPYTLSSSFVNPESLVTVLSTFYSHPVAIQIRTRLITGIRLPRHENIVSNMLMVMRYYGCKHLELIQSMISTMRTMVWTDPTFTNEVKLFLSERDKYIAAGGSLEYVGSISRLPLGLQQSNFPVIIHVIKKTTEGQLKNYKMKDAKFPTAHIDELLKVPINRGTMLSDEQRVLLHSLGVDYEAVDIINDGSNKRRQTEVWKDEINYRKAKRQHDEEMQRL